ncbi:unnamed protein product [Brassicogethes aeneus]|uniref:MYND-type domain-containing protein n=1 Tax=Brassicogethes aeneus TaxID=1431903 RepID=A0A9P0FKY4_BRAAE|nr:unnamed protein product [Brassicogethes aeneus]
MSHVDLGFLEDCDDWQVESRLFPSKVGGKPAWLDLESLPKVDDLKCGKCGKVMLFLCQIYAPIEDDDDNFHRTLFVFVCRNGGCCERNDSRNIGVLRCSLRRQNKFYDFDAPKEEPDLTFDTSKWVKLCNLCGSLAEKHCSQCKKVAYCEREHQVLDWKEGHKTECNFDKIDRKSSILFPQHEIVIEPEDITENTTDENKEIEEFKKLQSEGRTGTLNEIPESDLDAHATTDTDKAFSKFKKKISENPDQILRYQRNGKPLWIASEPIPVTIPECELCGSARQFEFQIMPQLLTMLKEDELDWGVIAIYTCNKSCMKNAGYVKEYVFKQDVALNSF